MIELEVVAILDRSGSMSGVVDETIKGFNSFLKEQQTLTGEVLLSTVLFDHEVEILHDAVDLKKVPLLTPKEYFTRGSTALLDAVGQTIIKLDRKYATQLTSDLPKQVIVLIITDGYENASHEFTWKQVQHLIKEKTAKDHWKFLFLGANMDAAQEAAKLNIDHRHSATFEANQEGVRTMFQTVNDTLFDLRMNGDVSVPLDEAIKKRKKKH